MVRLCSKDTHARWADAITEVHRHERQLTTDFAKSDREQMGTESLTGIRAKRTQLHHASDYNFT